jgi:hypothetical protein
MAVGRGHNRGGRSRTGGQFFKLTKQITGSAGFRALSGSATKILLAIACRYNGRNNGDLHFSVREGKDWGVGKSQTALALHELVDMGFLRVTRRGCFTTKRLAATYALTCVPVNVPSTQPATLDFLTKKIPSPAERTDSPVLRTVERTEPECRAA